jgi:hypothetical protein
MSCMKEETAEAARMHRYASLMKESGIKAKLIVSYSLFYPNFVQVSRCTAGNYSLCLRSEIGLLRYLEGLRNIHKYTG